MKEQLKIGDYIIIIEDKINSNANNGIFKVIPFNHINNMNICDLEIIKWSNDSPSIQRGYSYCLYKEDIYKKLTEDEILSWLI